MAEKPEVNCARPTGGVLGQTKEDPKEESTSLPKEEKNMIQVGKPAPDFIAEILSDSTASVDRGVKFQDYAAHGVGEYWIVDPVQQTIEQYRLQAPNTS